MAKICKCGAEIREGIFSHNYSHTCKICGKEGCDEDGLIDQCSYCERGYCSEHLPPAKHKCKNYDFDDEDKEEPEEKEETEEEEEQEEIEEPKSKKKSKKPNKEETEDDSDNSNSFMPKIPKIPDRFF